MIRQFIILLLLCTQMKAFAQTQDAPTSFTYAEFRGGYGVNIFGNGLKEKYNAGNSGCKTKYYPQIFQYRYNV